MAKFVLPKVEKVENKFISHMNFNSKHYEQCKSALKFGQLLTIPPLFPLKVVQNGNVANFVHYGKTAIHIAVKLMFAIANVFLFVTSILVS